MNKYEYYQTEDFLRDESFINWVLDPEGRDQTWNEWMKSNPDKKDAAQKAIDIIRSFDFKKEPVADQFYVDLKQRIDQTIAQQRQRPARRATLVPVWLKVAAIITGIILGGYALYFYWKPSYTTISTPYAAIKTVWLPDSSEVVLNANSTIRFQPGKSFNKRDVWITGEAFFKVRHISIAGEAQHFTVYAGDAKIEVLGTEFNVKCINKTTGVMLRQGKVRFSVPATHAQTIMNPNDYCIYSATQSKILTHVANPVLYTSWMEQKYRFEKTPAREVCKTLKEYFGYDFIIRKPELAEQPISGTLELQNEQVMYSILSELLNASVTKQGDSVVIE